MRVIGAAYGDTNTPWYSRQDSITVLMNPIVRCARNRLIAIRQVVTCVESTWFAVVL